MRVDARRLGHECDDSFQNEFLDALKAELGVALARIFSGHALPTAVLVPARQLPAEWNFGPILQAFCLQPRSRLGSSLNALDVSVVISTFNRASVLPRALGALMAQKGTVRYEVIAVDNGSTDNTAAIIQSMAAAAPDVHYIHEPQRGLPYGRNAGVRAARSDIIAFTDDDVEVPPNWVETIVRLFATHPDVDMIGGRVKPTWPASVPDWLTHLQLGPFALGERGDTPFRIGASNAAPCLVGANFAFRRRVFDRVGLFDPTYTKSQDREIQLRLWRAGGVGLYAPEMAISVDVPPERLTKKYFRYWYRTYGVYHSRMRLLDALDRDGGLTDPPARRIFGVPGFIYRSFIEDTFKWLSAAARFDRTGAFYHENRCRYLASYIRERLREGRRRPAVPRAPASSVAGPSNSPGYP